MSMLHTVRSYFPTVQVEVCADRAVWLEARRTGLGGSDIAAVLGHHPHKSKLAVYADKLIPYDESEASVPLYLRIGNDLESYVTSLYAEETGATPIDAGRYTLLRHARYPYLTATLDRILPATGPEGHGVLEIKTALGFASAARWNGGVPLEHQIQLQHQMLVTGAQWGVIAALTAGPKFVWRRFDRHAGLHAVIRREAATLWSAVEARRPPAPDGREASRDALAALYPVGRPLTLQLPDAAAQWDAAYVAAQEARTAAMEAQQTAENHIKAALGDAESGLLPHDSEYFYRWKQEGSRGSRTLRRMRRA